MRLVSLKLAVVSAVAFGCGGDRRQWEVSVENKSGGRRSITVKMGEDGSRGAASIDGLENGESAMMLVGLGGQATVVHSVKVTSKNVERTSKPNKRLKSGERFKIVIDENDEVKTAIEELRP